MDRANLLKQWFRDHGIYQTEVARRTGYGATYVSELLNGLEPLSDSARIRIAEEFPETAGILLAPCLQSRKGGANGDA